MKEYVYKCKGCGDGEECGLSVLELDCHSEDQRSKPVDCPVNGELDATWILQEGDNEDDNK